MVTVIEVETNARGIRAGVGHNWTRWPRSVVEQCQALRAAGLTYRDIRDELGVPISTAQDWVTGRRRRPPARVVVKRVKERGSFGVNHQRTASANVDQPEKQGAAGVLPTTPFEAIPSSLPSPPSCRG